MKNISEFIQVKATEHCFPVGLFIILDKVVLTFETMDEILTYFNNVYVVVQIFLCFKNFQTIFIFIFLLLRLW